jgi:hypothetical protein
MATPSYEELLGLYRAQQDEIAQLRTRVQQLERRPCPPKSRSDRAAERAFQIRAQREQELQIQRKKQESKIWKKQEAKRQAEEQARRYRDIQDRAEFEHQLHFERRKQLQKEARNREKQLKKQEEARRLRATVQRLREEAEKKIRREAKKKRKQEESRRLRATVQRLREESKKKYKQEQLLLRPRIRLPRPRVLPPYKYNPATASVVINNFNSQTIVDNPLNNPNFIRFAHSFNQAFRVNNETWIVGIPINISELDRIVDTMVKLYNDDLLIARETWTNNNLNLGENFCSKIQWFVSPITKVHGDKPYYSRGYSPYLMNDCIFSQTPVSLPDFRNRVALEINKINLYEGSNLTPNQLVKLERDTEDARAKGDKENYNPTPKFIFEIRNFFYPLAVGGCLNHYYYFNSFRTTHLSGTKVTLPSESLNCGIAALLFGVYDDPLDPVALDLLELIQTNSINDYYNELRSTLNIPLNTLLSVPQLVQIAAHFERQIRVFDHTGDIIYQDPISLQTPIDILYERTDLHYSYLTDIQLTERCSICSRPFHPDEDCAKANRKTRFLPSKSSKFKKLPQSLDTLYFIDFETAPFIENDTLVHKPIAFAHGYHGFPIRYATSIPSSPHYVPDLNEHLLSVLRDVVTLNKKKAMKICSYNGSGFDNYILLNELFIRNNVKFYNYVIAGTKILNFEAEVLPKPYKRLRPFDPFLHLRCSLSEACKMFNLPERYSKTTFDHLSILTDNVYDESKAVLHESELRSYCMRDVKSLQEVVFRSQQSLDSVTTNLFPNNPRNHLKLSDFWTAPSLTYYLWNNARPDVPLSVPNAEEYEFIRRGTFGARVYPAIQSFSSEDQHLTSFDVNSLYPFVMANNEFGIGEPFFAHTAASQLFDSGTFGLYEVSFECSPHFVDWPLFPQHQNDGSLSWNNLPKDHEVYTHAELIQAIRLNYIHRDSITFHKALIWKNTSKVFQSYINFFYNMKSTAQQEGNTPLAQYAKLMMNSLFGKMLQHPIESQTEIISTLDEFHRFDRDFNITSVIDLPHNTMAISGDTKNKEMAIQTSLHLGTFILAYARVAMTNIRAQLGPFSEHCFYYTDTDSLLLHASKVPAISSIIGTDLGQLKDETKSKGNIHEYYAFGPKVYATLGKLGDNVIDSIRCKGIPKFDINNPTVSLLTFDDFRNENSKKIKFGSFERDSIKSDFFSIKATVRSRTFLQTEWRGMDRISFQDRTIFLPLGSEYDISNTPSIEQGIFHPQVPVKKEEFNAEEFNAEEIHINHLSIQPVRPSRRVWKSAQHHDRAIFEARKRESDWSLHNRDTNHSEELTVQNPSCLLLLQTS